MASIVVALLIFFILFAAIEAQKKTSNVIRLGSSLSPIRKPNSWLSPSGLFAFGFYPEKNGFAVGIWIIGHPNNTVVWTANRDYPPVSSNSTIEFTSDGRLILNHTQQATELDIAGFNVDVNTGRSRRAVSAHLLDSGNFMLYDNDSSVIWQSFDSPTDTILGNQTLYRDGELVSSVSSSSDHSRGRYCLLMQDDENLVAYPVNSTRPDPADAYWASDTSDLKMNSYTNLNLNFNGVLFLGENISNIQHTLANSSISSIVGNINHSVNEIIYRATLDDDGIFRLYSHRFVRNKTGSMVSVQWSAFQDRCQVVGFCGLNSYCSSNGSKPECYCYPGFVPFNPGKKFLGCYRNFTEHRCRSEKGGPGLVNITSLENLRWRGHSYSAVPMKKEDCRKSCLEDCNCGAALYFSRQCRKHKLPLRYGARNLRDSTTAFIKVSLGTSGAAKIPHQLTPDSPSNPIVVIENKRHLISILAVSLGSLACLCIVIASSTFFVYRHRVHKYKKLSNNTKLGLTTEEFSLRSFSYNELEEATQGFKEELGKGSFGTVYKGTLSGGGNKNIVVAVKRLENVPEEDEDSHREFRFQTEVTAIGRTHHRNLVQLLGFCVEGRRKLLVYEYMSNGSLANVLFKATDHQRRPGWKERVRIVLDIARGILYLHEECEACIVHCGIKPQNILMDDSWTAKISDFGLAKLLLPNHTTSITGRSRGVTVSSGPVSSYLAPEWQGQQQKQQQQLWKQDLISVKADIYSFGVVLLEVICCRRNIEVNVSNADEIILSTWVYKCFVTGELYKLVGDEWDECDEEIRADLKTLERMVKVGLWCVQDDPGLRPSIKSVILMLEGTMNILVPPHPSLLDNT
ncbi:G-type lectin S-receptor-like serine/threonine-protein kinase LECRK1 [Camellia sinensis]|uniref:Receptor-like serine/threonine-protein kinase n=1 Tax=Camellia sinensis var. sinensis TaxID=542762 RepID=A0A4S4DX60_CAMSN|nr:G-type lectin S-receptor-like serine/threonine-protein kinase LECRK1 [Camellia sinensis]THG07952.1 hypothetical protein TEA_003796 [Camellia sinensis var. sinensis]